MTYAALLADRALVPEPVVLRLAWAVPVEFAVVHASGFLALPWVARWEDGRKRAGYAALLATLYTLALAIVSLALGEFWPLAVFWGLMANRMLVVVVGDLPDDRAFSAWAIAWAGTTTLYVLAVCAGALAGGTNTTRALAAGFLYFTLVALSEITRWAWVHRWQARAARRAGRKAGEPR